jgi:hypothetical protein
MVLVFFLLKQLFPMEHHGVIGMGAEKPLLERLQHDLLELRPELIRVHFLQEILGGILPQLYISLLTGWSYASRQDLLHEIRIRC